MNSTAQLTSLRQQTDGLSRTERAKLCCDVAKQLEKVGEYRAAAEAMDEFWPDHDANPKVDGLEPSEKAAVLLRLGNSTGRLGSAGQTGGSHERAKDLIPQSGEIFEAAGDDKGTVEARGDQALCYWRESAFDEARI